MTATGDAGARRHARTRVRGSKSLMYSKGVRCPVCGAHLDLGATVRLRGRLKEDDRIARLNVRTEKLAEQEYPISHFSDDEPPATAEDDSDG